MRNDKFVEGGVVCTAGATASAAGIGLAGATADCAAPFIAVGPVGWAALGCMAGVSALLCIGGGTAMGSTVGTVAEAMDYGRQLHFVSSQLRQAASSFTAAVERMSELFNAIVIHQKGACARSGAAAARASALHHRLFSAHADVVIRLSTTAHVYLTRMQHDVTFLQLSQTGVRAWVAGLDGGAPGMAELKRLAGF